MFDFLRLANDWLLSQQPNAAGPGRKRTASALANKAARNRSRKQLMIEPMEDRVLLSAADPRSLAGTASAEVFRIKKSPSLLAGVSGNGIQGGSATLTATLSSGGAPLAGKTIQFQIQGRAVGKAKTNDQGIAVLSIAKLKGVKAGVYARGLAATFAGDSGHKLKVSRGGLTVSRFSTTLSGVSASGVYSGNGSLTASLNSNGAPVPGQALVFHLAGRTVGSATTDAQGVANLANVSLAGLNAGTYANQVTASFAGNTRYGLNAASGILTVAKAQATIALGDLSQTYSATAKLATATTTPVGLAVSTSYTDANGPAVTAPEAAGNYHITSTITDPNYTGSATALLVVAKAPLTVSGVTAANKVYDGNTNATLDTSGAALAGVVAGDTVTLTVGSATGAFDTKNVGTAKTVSVSGLSLTGADSGNYILTQPTTTADITAATLTVTGITAANKGYDGSTDATLDTSGAALVGVVPSDAVALDSSGATGAFDSADIGTGKTVTISGLVLSGADALDYVLTQPTTTADITIGTLTVSGITAASKVYDGTTGATLDTSGATLVGVVPGDAVTLDASGATGTFATKDVGTGKTVTIAGLTFSGADAGKYMLVQPTTTTDITAATLTVNGITSANKVYDGTANAALDTGGAVLVGAVPGDAVALDVSGATGAFDTKSVGTGKNVSVSGLSLTGADRGNYILTQPTTTADITAATLTVTGITAANKVYDGTTDATLDTSIAVLVGAVPGDDVTLDASGAAGTFDTKDVGTAKTVSVSGLSVTGADFGNYILTEPTTTADITAATLTVTGITAANKVYDGTTDATLDTSSATLVGAVAGDDVTLDASGATGTFDTKDVGTAKTVSVSGLSLTGADIGNYILTQPTTTADITAATLTVNGITAANKVYDGTTDATLDTSSATLVGAVPGDDVTLDVSGATGTFDTKDVGTAKTVSVSGLSLTGADSGNYILTQPTTTADITAATLTVTGITAANKVYDGTTDATLDTSSATLVGAVAGDDVTLDASGAAGTFDTKDVGTAKTVSVSGLSLTGADIGNYILTQPTTTADMTAATLTVTGITASDKAFDGNTNATIDTTSALLVGVVNGDDVTLDTNGAIGTFDSPDVGNNKTVFITGLTITGVDSGNYILTQPTTTASVT
jgi:trimeric autotransporter adhesin